MFHGGFSGGEMLGAAALARLSAVADGRSALASRGAPTDSTTPAKSRPKTELRLRNCPFDALSRRFEPVVCGAGVALVEGIVDGMEASGVRVGREPKGGRCCIYLVSNSRPMTTEARA